jgi:hypothetical protein
MLGIVFRCASLLCIAALIAGLSAPCAGWEGSPEARLACCADGECPMDHEEGASGNGDTRISQLDADRCCAASEPSSSTLVFSAVPA